jgi:hypothetical protein
MSLQQNLDELKQYRKQRLEPVLKSLHEKNAHIKQVYEYCTKSYLQAQSNKLKKRVEKETMEYLQDLSMNREIEATSECILTYLDMTVELAGKIVVQE